MGEADLGVRLTEEAYEGKGEVGKAHQRGRLGQGDHNSGKNGRIEHFTAAGSLFTAPYTIYSLEPEVCSKHSIPYTIVDLKSRFTATDGSTLEEYNIRKCSKEVMILRLYCWHGWSSPSRTFSSVKKM